MSDGKRPKFTFELDGELRAECQQAAEQLEVSLSQFAREALRLKLLIMNEPELRKALADADKEMAYSAVLDDQGPLPVDPVHDPSLWEDEAGAGRESSDELVSVPASEELLETDEQLAELEVTPGAGEERTPLLERVPREFYFDEPDVEDRAVLEAEVERVIDELDDVPPEPEEMSDGELKAITVPRPPMPIDGREAAVARERQRAGAGVLCSKNQGCRAPIHFPGCPKSTLRAL